MRATLSGLFIAFSLALSPSAALAAEPVNYPDADGWTFDADAEGFKGTISACTLLDLISSVPTCIVTNAHNKADGVPKGSLESSMTTVVNTQGLFAAQGTWSSPSFTLPAGTPVGVVTMFLDRKAILSGEFFEQNLALRSDAVLVDETDGKKQTLAIRDNLGGGDAAAWVRRTRALGADSLVAGHTYHVDIVTAISSSSAREILAKVGVLYDNVRVRVAEPEKGDPGAPGSPGSEGTAGQPGSIGPQGPAGPGSAQVLDGKDGVVNSSTAKRLLEIDKLMPVKTTGGFANQMRTRVKCKGAVAERCEGAVKVRTAELVSVRGPGGKMSKKRLTFGTGAYQIGRRRSGYAKAVMTPLYKKFLLKKKQIKVIVQVTVLDEKGFQQTLERTFTMRIAKGATKKRAASRR